MANVFRAHKHLAGRLLLLVVTASFIAKVIAGYFIKGSFFSRGNMFHPMNALASSLIERWEFSVVPGIASVDYEPLYPLLLAASYRVFGTGWFGVTVVQGVMYGLTSWLLFLIGRRLLDEFAGLVAAAYHSLYPYLFFQSLSVIDTTLYTFLIVSSVYAAIRSREALRGYSWHIAVGGTAGLAVLSRVSALALLPPVVLYAVLRPSAGRTLRGLAVVSAAALLVLSPWFVRNYAYTKTLILSTHGASAFWSGNNEYAYGFMKNGVSLDYAYRLGIGADLYGKDLPPAEAVGASRKYVSEAVRFITEKPGEFMKLAAMKFIRFWSWVHNPASPSYAYGDASGRKAVYFISYAPLLLALPPGLYILRKKAGAAAFMLIGVFSLYALAHMVSVAHTRLRLPLDPLLMVLFGVVVSYLHSWKRSTQHGGA